MHANRKLAPLTGLELHLHLLLLLPLINLAIFLPTYLPSLLFSCGKNVNLKQFVVIIII